MSVANTDKQRLAQIFNKKHMFKVLKMDQKLLSMQNITQNA